MYVCVCEPCAAELSPEQPAAPFSSVVASMAAATAMMRPSERHYNWWAVQVDFTLPIA
jgi:hypothetical protein